MELFDEPYLDLSFFNPITLSTLETFFKTSSTSSIRDNLYTSLEESLQLYFKPNSDKICPVHRCLNWLSENKSCVTKIPSDIVSDYQNHQENIKLCSNDVCYNFRRAVYLLKNKINHETNMEMLRRKKDENKLKMKPTNFKGNKKNLLSLQLNYNTNRPCCNSNTMKINNEEMSDENFPLFMKSHLTKSYTQEYDNNMKSILNRDESSDMDYLKKNSSKKDSSKKDSSPIRPYTSKSEETATFEVDQDALLLSKISKSYKASSKMSSLDSRAASSETESTDYITVNQLTIPKLNMSQRFDIADKSKLQEGNSLFLFLESIYQKHSRVLMVPKEFNICYKFYVYMYPSQSDNQLRLFQIRGLRQLAKHMDPFDMGQLISDLKADFLLDRRLEMIESHCNCRIILEPLSMNFINGLPHRPINIYSKNYEYIAKALSILEEVMPELMKTAILKDKLPSIYSKKWSSKDLVHRPQKLFRSNHGCANWVERIDPNKRFPSTKSSMNKTVRFLSQNTPKQTSENCIVSFSNLSKLNTKQMNRNSTNKDDQIENEHVQIISNSNQKSNVTISISIETSEIQNKEYKISSLHSKMSSISNKDGNHEVEIVSKKITTPSITTNNNQSFEYKHIKRIKCPGTIFSQSIFNDENTLKFLSAKYQCCIAQLDSNIKMQLKNKNKQIKLTIMYNSKLKFYRFCQRLGLSIKSK